MVMKYILEGICALLSIVALGHAMQKGSTRFDKIAFSVISFAYILMCMHLMGVL